MAAAVSAVVDLNYRRSREASRTRTEAEVLSALAAGYDRVFLIAAGLGLLIAAAGLLLPGRGDAS
ncbi:hypothetical protein GCM10023178_71720 [Actinomadura luteofluorescens]